MAVVVYIVVGEDIVDYDDTEDNIDKDIGKEDGIVVAAVFDADFGDIDKIVAVDLDIDEIVGNTVVDLYSDDFDDLIERIDLIDLIDLDVVADDNFENLIDFDNFVSEKHGGQSWIVGWA